MSLKHLIIPAVLTAAGTLSAHQSLQSSVQQQFVSGGTIRMHLEAGGYTIDPTDTTSITVTYHANSESHLKRVNVEIKARASSADVYVRHTPYGNFTATIEVPRHSNLWVRLSAGELDIRAVDGDKNLEMMAGQLQVEIAHPELYGHRDASVTTGSIESSAFRISKGGLFRSFEQEGPGQYRLHAHVLAGEIDLRGGH